MTIFARYCFPFALLLLGVTTHGQVWKKQITKKTTDSVLMTYSWESRNDVHSAYGEITLLKNGRFKYFSQRPLELNQYCEGYYILDGNKLILNSDLQNDNIPVNIEYVDAQPLTSLLNRLDFPINNKGEVLYSGYYFLNYDTTSKGWFDPAYPLNRHWLDSVKSIKVLFNEADFSSRWIPVERSDKLIRVKVLTDKNFTTYKPIVFKDRTFEIQNETLSDISGKK